MTQNLFRPTLFLFAMTTISLACGDSKNKCATNTDASKDVATDAGVTTDSSDAADTATASDASDASDGATLAALQARGKYLVGSVIACGACHTPNGPTGPDMTKFLAGDPDFAVLPNGDKLGTRNLTNDATGLKNRTDDEIKAMFMDGKRPVATGGTEALNPFMPYYVFHNMRAADADAIVAYLRTVPAVENMIPRRGASFDVPAPAPPLDLTKIPTPAADFAEKASALRGQYLATQSGVCVECHTKHLAPGAATVLDEANLFAGGEDYSALFAASLMITPVSKNITSDVATGIGGWTTTEIVNTMTMGKAKDGSGICPPMPVGPNGAYGSLTAQDATDIANYIRSLPPKTNLVADMCVFPPMGGAGGAGGGAGGAGGGRGGAGGGTAGAGGGTAGAGGDMAGAGGGTAGAGGGTAGAGGGGAGGGAGN